jgi:hypothetical protein
MFSAVYGQQLRESDSPSFYNLPEVVRVVEIVAALAAARPDLPLDEFAVVAPYRKQARGGGGGGGRGG